MSYENIEQLIRATESGDSEARRQLFASLYNELHNIARRQLRGSVLTLGATTLLHEAYLKLGGRQGASFPDRARFLAYASRAMRGLILDYARSGRALKRGGGFDITSMPEEAMNVPAAPAESEELERLSEAIERLVTVQPRLAQIVDLKYFAGFSFADIAAMWGVSERTVQRDWEKARLFLHHDLTDQNDDSHAVDRSAD